MPAIDQEFKAAVAQVQAGQLTAGRALCERILAHNPRHDAALSLLAAIAAQSGDLPNAVELVGRAIAFAPRNAPYHCNLGLFLEQSGQSEQAIASFRKAIALHPNYPEAHLNLGLSLAKTGDTAAAIACYQHSIRLRSSYPKAHNCLGLALADQKDLPGAIASFRQAISQNPDYAEAWNNLGNAQADQGAEVDAITSYRRAVELGSAAAGNNLGLALFKTNQTDLAISVYRQAIQRKPGLAEIHHNLARALIAKQDHHAALESVRQAIAIQPHFPAAFNTMGTIFKALRMAGPQAQAFHTAVQQDTDFAEAHFNFANSLVETGQFVQAVPSYERAMELAPQNVETKNNLANLLKDQGKISRAISLYRQALTLSPDYIIAHDNLIYTAIYDPATPPEFPLQQSRIWEQQHLGTLKSAARAGITANNPARKLRIGFVSPDFREHAVSLFMLPLLGAIDHTQLEIFGYANVSHPDQVTASLQKLANHWCDISAMDDDAVAEKVRQDQIDILFDLAGHSGSNRLPVFARRPAPVQVTYLGYPATTGLTAMDYRLTDELSDPPGSERFHSEKLVRLPKTMWCFQPPENSAELAEPPATGSGIVTFGSFNNFAKVNEPLLDLWARILQSVPGSTLLLKARGVEPAGVQADVLARMASNGISADRIRFLSWVPAAEHLRCFQQVDIALDSFPYHGTTTTCETLWMGVPVVTLAGQTHVSRVGLSLLTNVGLRDLVAENADEYVSIAVALANDVSRLRVLRVELRERLRRSPITDAPQFARDFEQACRTMWQAVLQEPGTP